MPSARAAALRDEVVRHMVTDGFAFLGNPPVRWLDGPVTFRVANAEPALGAATTQTMVASALAAWPNVPPASITLGFGPATGRAHPAAAAKCGAATSP